MTRKSSLFIMTIMLGFIVLSSNAISNLKSQYSLRQFLPKTNSLLTEDGKIKTAFQLSEIQPFIITAQDDSPRPDWLTKEKTNLLAILTEEIKELPHVKNAVSVATIQGVISKDKTLTVGPILKNTDIKDWKRQIFERKHMSPFLISQDFKIASIIVDIASLNSEDIGPLKKQLEELAQSRLPFARITVGGVPAIQTELSSLLQNEIRNFVILALLTCFVSLGLIFTSSAPLLISFIIIFCTNILVLGFMTIAGYSFSILSSTIPILVTVDVLSLCIHTLLRYKEEAESNPGRPLAFVGVNSLKSILGPNLIASLTTMIGFLSLLTSDVPLIKEYGLTASISIIIGWVVSTVLFLPLITLFPNVKTRGWVTSKSRWALKIFHWSKPILAITCILFFAFTLQGRKLFWTAKIFDDLPAQQPIKTSTDIIEKKLGGVVPIDISINGPSGMWESVDNLNQLHKLIESIRANNSISSVLGLPEIVFASNNNLNLPTSNTELAEVYFLHSLSVDTPLKNFVNTDFSSTRISVRTMDLPENRTSKLIDELRQVTKKYFPTSKVQLTGMGVTVPILNKTLSQDLIFGFWKSMALIVLVLAFLFRSLRWALVSCLPNLVPPAVLLSFLSMSETAIKPSVAIIFSIALGLSFNNTVYLLERLRSLQRKSPSARLNIKKALWIEGNPCLISSLILLSGFSVFTASYFSMNKTFGIYMSLSVIAGIIGDLVFLPALIKTFPHLLGIKKNQSNRVKAKPNIFKVS